MIRSMEIRHEEQMKELREEMKKELEAAKVKNYRRHDETVKGKKMSGKSKHNHSNNELNTSGSRVNEKCSFFLIYRWALGEILK